MDKYINRRKEDICTKARGREISVEKSEQDEYRLRTHPSAKRDDEVGTESEGILGGERKTKTTGQSTEGQRTEGQRTEGQRTEGQSTEIQ